MTSNLRRQPNYTCIETVERSRRSGAARKFQLQDTLRLEVALVEGKEMFAWPGSRKFEDADLRTMVSTGTFGNGNFALHARAIFQGRGPTFQYRGQTVLDGQAAFQFDYRVALFESGYQIRVAEKEARVGYHGAFYADPASFNVRRLEVIADDIPAELGMSQATDVMDYGNVPIGGAEFLLPVRSQLTLIDLHGQESRNETRFTSCRQFTGDSTLSFGDPPPDLPAAAEPVQEIELPGNLEVALSLLDGVDTENAAVGDPLRARLNRDLRYKGNVLFSKGAVATGRVTRIERRSDYIVLGLEFDELAAPGAHAQLKLKLENVTGAQILLVPARRVPYELNPKPGEGLIPLRGGLRNVLRGILMSWRT
jgi:hypothetical protein